MKPDNDNEIAILEAVRAFKLAARAEKEASRQMSAATLAQEKAEQAHEEASRNYRDCRHFLIMLCLGETEQ